MIVSIILFSSACTGPKKIKQSKIPLFQQTVENSPVFNNGFTGFVLFDPSNDQTIFAQNAHRYFTPASNTKIWTLYACLNILGDSIPGIQYTNSGDSLIFWGTGDPMLKNPYLKLDNQVIRFLKETKKNIYFSAGNFNDTPLGAGWMWDDSYYHYQPEKSGLPFHGNVIMIDKQKDDPYFRVTPSYFSKSFELNKDLAGRSLKRKNNLNIFQYNEKMQNRKYQNEHPFIYSDELAINLLKEEIQKDITILKQSRPIPARVNKIYSTKVDTVYQSLMLDSDNFIAEQLLLVCSDTLFGDLNTAQVIKYTIDSLLQDSPDTPIWADGSGLSRYNLFTPRSIVFLLDKLYQDVPRDRLMSFFPAGGYSGTIKNWYDNSGTPYVFAKTGTMSNNHCLSGYLITRSGKTLIFSFMHNNFKGSSKPYKEEMEKVLRAIYLNY